MNKEIVRAQFIRDKVFLRNLYESNGNLARVKQILTFASDTELNTLIKFLHFLSSGDIRIKRDNFQILIQHNKLQVLKKAVEKKKAIKDMLASNRQNKLLFLKKLALVYPNLLFCLFHE